MKKGILILVPSIIPPVKSQLTIAFLMRFVWFTN